MRKFIREKFSTPGQTFDDKFPTVGTTAFDSSRYWDSRFLELYSRFQSPGFRIPQGKVPSFRNPNFLTLPGFKSRGAGTSRFIMG